MRPIERWCLGFRCLPFLDKHVVIGTIVTIIGTVFTGVLAFAVFRVTTNLQAQATYLQQAQFRIEENEGNAERARAATRAFGIASKYTSPGSERGCNPTSGSQRR